MRQSGFTLMQLLVAIGVLVVLALILVPVFLYRGDRVIGNGAACQRNMKQIMLEMIAYAQDYDNKFPLAQGNGLRTDPDYGWAGSIQGYLKDPTAMFHCPQVGTSQPMPTGDNGFTDYYYNLRLSGFEEKNMSSVSNTIALGEGNDGVDIADAAYSKSRLPSNWVTDTTKPSFRHVGGANYAFVDGHVKWLRPTVPTTGPVSSSVFTFAQK